MSEHIKHNSYQSGLYVLLGLLVFLNLAAFWIYHEAHASEFLSLQIWKYLDSGAFKLISASLILPIILLLLESKFKLAETALRNLEDRRRMEDQARRERTELERQDRKSRRLEALSQTIKWWNDLYDVSAEIRFFTKPKGDRPTIEDSLKVIKRLASTGEDVVNMWVFRFPNLLTGDIEIFLVFFNILLKSSETVAQSIRRNVMTSQEIEVLQDCLGVILEGVKNIAHHKIINILKLSSEILEADEDVDKTLRDDLVGARKANSKDLREWAASMLDHEKTRNNLLCTIEGDEIKNLRMKAHRLEQWTSKNPDRNLLEFEEYNEMRDAFFKICTEDRVMAQSIYYSPEYVKFLADLVGFVNFQMEVARRGRSFAIDDVTASPRRDG